MGRACQRSFGALALLFFCVACYSAPRAPAPGESADAGADAPASVAGSERGGLLAPVLALIRQHRETATHMDGPRCPLYPSCATYGDQAVREYGLWGLIMLVDRLFYREFGELRGRYRLAPARISATPRYLDPVDDALPPYVLREPSLLQEDSTR